MFKYHRLQLHLPALLPWFSAPLPKEVGNPHDDNEGEDEGDGNRDLPLWSVCQTQKEPQAAAVRH